jgi:hypothetical protein
MPHSDDSLNEAENDVDSVRGLEQLLHRARVLAAQWLKEFFREF